MDKKQVPSTANNAIVSTLETRLGMYKKAIDTARSGGDAAKARRYDRQYKVSIFLYEIEDLVIIFFDI